ncbi:MAG: hypothetical protein KA052_02595 [Candidatus Pacebacteria bacterium]|nr:hypothetical protein [Candidatus Paceibacterota bacterium]
MTHKIALANEEPRSAWRILSDWGFRGGNAEQTALRADHLSSPVLDFEFLRSILDEVRMYFAENPE